MEHRPVRTVLVVDDEELLRMLVALTLDDGRYRVVPAEDGERGLALAQELLPDLVLLDIGLPKMDGLEVCRRLRADERTRGLKIVILSARATDRDHALGFAAGADGYLDKPFRPLEFRVYLDRLFGP